MRFLHVLYLMLFVLTVLNCLVFDHTLCFHEHVEQIARNCNQRFYLLQQLRKQGLSDECLKVLFHAIVLSKILYAVSVWGGYISIDNVDRSNKILR